MEPTLVKHPVGVKPVRTGASKLARSRAALSNRTDLDAFLGKLGAKERLQFERHLTTSETEPDPRHAQLWRRLACTLFTLSPFPPKVIGQQSIQYFIPDGRYRMQVFALHDPRNGTLMIYCENVLDEAVSSGLLTAPKEEKDEGDGMHFYRIGRSRELLQIEVLDGRTPNPAPVYKDMTGWNRKAIGVILPVASSEVQIEAVELLCALAAQTWVVATPAAKE